MLMRIPTFIFIPMTIFMTILIHTYAHTDIILLLFYKCLDRCNLQNNFNKIFIKRICEDKFGINLWGGGGGPWQPSFML